MYRTVIFITIIFTCVCCNNSSNDNREPQKQSEKLPENLFVKEKPEQAVNVTTAKTLKPGSPVTVFGRIMGRKKPFVEGYASFIIGDEEKISVCTDQCGFPWDCCCDDKVTRANATLSIQIVNENDKPIKTDLKGQGGLKELSIVVVEGVVDSSSTDAFMIVNANKIFVE